MMTPTPPPTPAPVSPSELAVRISPLAGLSLSLFMAAGLMSSGWLLIHDQNQWLPTRVSSEQIMQGEVTHRISRELSRAELPRQAADLERGASWLLLNDSGPRVRQGCPGWLFLADEMTINQHAELNAQTKAQAVIDLQQTLAKHGIHLLVAVVPDKSRIAVTELSPLRRPQALQGRIQAWTTRLEQAGVANVDLTSTLSPLGAAAYLRTDTHWSEIGAKAAADVIAQRVKALMIDATPHKAFDVSTAEIARRPGDLVRLAGIDWLPLKWQPAAENVAATQISERAEEAVVGSDNLDDLLGDANLPNVALIGTSFSHNSSFAGFLQLALGAPIGNFAKDGGEFSGAAKDYFDSPAFKQTPPRLIVWEIPERDLQTPYHDFR